MVADLPIGKAYESFCGTMSLAYQWKRALVRPVGHPGQVQPSHHSANAVAQERACGKRLAQSAGSTMSFIGGRSIRGSGWWSHVLKALDL